MADIRDVRREAESVSRETVKPTLAEKAPPRPSDMPGTPSKGVGRADVSIRTESKDRVHVEMDTHEAKARGASAGGGWPKDSDEWKRLLAKAAPWVAAALIAAAAAYGYNKTENGERVGDRARRKADRAAREAGASAKLGWFGLKRRAEETAESAGDKLAEAGRAIRGKVGSPGPGAAFNK